MKKVSLCHKSNQKNANAQKPKKTQKELTHKKEDIQGQINKIRNSLDETQL